MGEEDSSSLTRLHSCRPVQTLLKSGEQCWSLAELVQAVVILAHCHSLCSFVFGCDTNSDLAPLSASPTGSPPTFCLFDAANANVPQSPANPTEHITPRRVRGHAGVFSRGASGLVVHSLPRDWEVVGLIPSWVIMISLDPSPWHFVLGPGLWGDS